MNLEKRGFPIHKFLLEFGLLRAGVEMDQNIVMVIVYAHVTLRRRNSYGRRCFNKKNRKSKTIWCLASDVNATRKKEDKVGLSTRPYTQNREMNDFNEFYELMELPNILMI